MFHIKPLKLNKDREYTLETIITHNQNYWRDRHINDLVLQLNELDIKFNVEKWKRDGGDVYIMNNFQVLLTDNSQGKRKVYKIDINDQMTELEQQKASEINEKQYTLPLNYNIEKFNEDNQVLHTDRLDWFSKKNYVDQISSIRQNKIQLYRPFRNNCKIVDKKITKDRYKEFTTLEENSNFNSNFHIISINGKE